MTAAPPGIKEKSLSQPSPPQHSVQTSALTFPAVCSQSNVSLVFPIWKTCLLSFGPQCSCQCKSGRTVGPIDTDVRKDSLCTPPGLISDSSLLLQRVSRRVGGELLWIANVKLPTCLLCRLQDVLWHTWDYPPITQRSFSMMRTSSLKMPIQCEETQNNALKTEAGCRPWGFILILIPEENTVCTFNPRGSLNLFIPPRIQPELSLCYVKWNGCTVFFLSPLLSFVFLKWLKFN